MDKRDAPEQASPEDEARIGETPAVFANKIYVSRPHVLLHPGATIMATNVSSLGRLRSLI